MHAADGERPVPQQAHIHHRLRMIDIPRRPAPPDATTQMRAEDIDERRAYAILPLVAVEHDLQARRTPPRPARSRYNRCFRPRFSRAARSRFNAGESLHQPGPTSTSDRQPDRHVDQEHPVPGKRIRQPAAEHRPHRRREHDRQAVQREGLRPFAQRETCRRKWIARPAPGRRRQCPAARARR